MKRFFGGLCMCVAAEIVSLLLATFCGSPIVGSTHPYRDTHEIIWGIAAAAVLFSLGLKSFLD